MACVCSTLGLVFYSLWIPFVLYLAYTWYTKKFNFLFDNPNHTSPAYLPFIRNDRKNWSVVEFILVGILLAPFRAALIVGSLLLGILLNKLAIMLYKIKDLEAEQPLGFVKITRAINTWISGLIMFGFGIRIRQFARKVDEAKYPKLRRVAETKKNTAVIVSNHVSWSDILYHINSEYKPCFISKAGVANYPVVGLFAKLIQCLFIERENVDQHAAVVRKLTERVENIRQGKNFSKLIIFPEGTTTNGNYVIPFKKGAFILGTPLKIMALKYKGRVSAAFSMMTSLDSAISIMFQLRTQLDAYAIEGLFEPNGKMEWEEFSESVRDLIATEFKFLKSQATFRDKMEIEMKCCNISEKEYK